MSHSAPDPIYIIIYVEFIFCFYYFFLDIGANLTDPMYNGLYHGSKKHEGDLLQVLSRAWDAGLSKIIITGGSLEDSKTALDVAKTNGNYLFFS